MSTPFQKRRRLNEETLYKPFKSPLRHDPNTSNHPSTLPHSTTLPHSSDNAATTPATTSYPTTHGHTIPPHPHVSRPANKPSVAHSTAASRALDSEIAQVRSAVEALIHALRLVSSARDAELVALTKKWRAASRAAAEELFAGVRDKVNRMGGVGAWREVERERVERRRDWEMPEGPDEMGLESEDEESEEEDEKEGSEAREKKEQQEERVRARREMRRERREGWEVEKREWDRKVEEERRAKESERVDSERDDDAFTMDMMLRTINIDLEVIGYDKQEQRWID